ncbi:MAG: tetratricopeptide repeat protein [Rubricoccaceae bacterium]|nr:tetratricopeptide repeat protein [Rubricoccaceae bacterium]
MTRVRVLLAPLLLLGVLMLAPQARAQVLPVTTSSEEARRHFLLGRTAAHHYQFAEAREHLDRALAADSTFVLALLHRAGSSYPHQRRPYFERALAHRDGVSDGERRLVDAFVAFLHPDRLDVDRAVGILTELSEDYPDDPYFPAYVGFRYRNDRRFAESAEQFEAALGRDSAFVQAYHWLGTIAMAQEDYAAAEDLFQEYLRRAPKRWRAHHALGTLRLRQGHAAEADAFLDRAAALDPSGEARSGVGYAYATAGRYEDAERIFRENARLHPDDPGVHHGLGTLYSRQGRYDEAAGQYRRALEVDPSFEPSRAPLARADIERKTAAWADAMIAGTVPDLVPDLFTEGAVLMVAGQQHEGRDAILAHADALPASGGAVFDLSDLTVVGDVAYGAGRYTVEDREGGEGAFLKVWRLGADGEWRIDRVMFQ